jgi:hypothetical protein
MVGVVSEEGPKDNLSDKAYYDRWTWLEESMKVVEESNLYDPVKATKICLVPNV